MSLKDLVNAEYLFRTDEGELDINPILYYNPNIRIYTCIQDEVAIEWLLQQDPTSYFAFFFLNSTSRLAYIFFDEQTELMFKLSISHISDPHTCGETIELIRRMYAERK